MHLNCEFIAVPRIVLNDKDLSSTDKLLLGLVVSLTLNKGYCFASNKYLSNVLNVSTRTISTCLSELKTQEYIIVKNDNKRKIYLNKEKIPTKASAIKEETNAQGIEKKFYHNKNNKYKNDIKVPEWFENQDSIKEELATKEEQMQIDELLKEYQD